LEHEIGEFAKREGLELAKYKNTGYYYVILDDENDCFLSDID